MKQHLWKLGLVAAVLLICYPALVVRFSHPALTETQLLVGWWPWYVAGLVVMVGSMAAFVRWGNNG